MKKFLTVIFFLAFSLLASAQTSVTKVSKKNKTSTTKSTAAEAVSDNASESLSLKETEFDFGKIPQGKPVTHVFKFYCSFFKVFKALLRGAEVTGVFQTSPFIMICFVCVPL